MTDTPDALAIVRDLDRLAAGDGSFYELAIAAANARPALAEVIARYEVMERALRKARNMGICAGASFVRGNPNRDQDVTAFLDLIDNALSPEKTT